MILKEEQRKSSLQKTISQKVRNTISKTNLKNKHENEHDDVIMKLKTHHPSTSHFKLKRPLSSHTQSTHTQSKVPSTSKAPYQTHPKATSLSSDTSSSSYISHTQSRAPLSS